MFKEAGEKREKVVSWYEALQGRGRIQEKDLRSSAPEQKFGRGYFRGSASVQGEVVRKCCSAWRAKGGFA